MKHYIIVKWNELVTDKAAMAERAEGAFAGVTALPGVTDCRVIRSCSSRPNRFDLVIAMEMTEEGLACYDASELHKRWKADFTQYFASKAVFDCEEGL